MAERGMRQEKRKSRAGEPTIGTQDRVKSDDDHATVAHEEPDESDMILSFKKRRVDNETPPENIGEPSDRKRKSAFGDDKVPQKNTRPPIKPPFISGDGPGSRYYPPEDYCLSKVLTAFEVIQEDAKLHLDAYDAYTLADTPEIAECPTGTYTKNLLVYDAYDRKFHMSLTNYLSGGSVRFALGGDWNKFVRIHNLKAGDEITFYQIYDRKVFDDYYYVIKYFRRPADRPPARNREKPDGGGDGGCGSGSGGLSSCLEFKLGGKRILERGEYPLGVRRK